VGGPKGGEGARMRDRGRGRKEREREREKREKEWNVYTFSLSSAHPSKRVRAHAALFVPQRNGRWDEKKGSCRFHVQTDPPPRTRTDARAASASAANQKRRIAFFLYYVSVDRLFALALRMLLRPLAADHDSP